MQKRANCKGVWGLVLGFIRVSGWFYGGSVLF